MAKRSSSRAQSAGIAYTALMAKKRWNPLPPVVALTGGCAFLKKRVVARFTETVFGDASERVVSQFRGPANDRELSTLPPAQVLDELRTPSFFSPYRVVVLEDAGAFLSAHGDLLSPFLETGFSGGYLVALVAGKLDGRRKITKAIGRFGWIVDCAQPYDRPPPWDSRTPAWDSELSRWIVAEARSRGLELDLRTAFVLHERAGTDLSVLDEELEKFVTLTTARGDPEVKEADILAITADAHDSSVFHLIDLFLEGRRSEALAEAERLFTHGYSSGPRGAKSTDPMGVAQLFIGAIVPRLRGLRRAQEMHRRGASSDDWLREGLVQRPFLGRFERQLRATPGARIAQILEALYDADRGMKRGGDPKAGLEMVLARAGPMPEARTR